MDVSVFKEKISFKMEGFQLYLPNCIDWGSYIFPFAITASWKIGVFTGSMKFVSPEVALYLYNLPYRRVWKTAVMSGLLVAAYLELLDNSHIKTNQGLSEINQAN